MLRLRSLVVLLIAGISVARVGGFIFRSSRSTSVSQTTNHHSTNNCHCNSYAGNMEALLKKLFGDKLGKRDAADILDLDEDYPGLDEFLEHAGMKRDGMIEKQDFVNAVKRQHSQSTQSNSPNVCHCGRMAVDQFNDLI